MSAHSALHIKCFVTTYVVQVPAEAVLEPESDAEERRARDEAANPNPQAKTLDEYEKKGHKV